MDPVVPLLITHRSKLFREALRYVLSNSRFRPVHVAPNLDQASENYLAAGGSCIWVIGVEKFSASTTSLVVQVGEIAPQVKRVVLAASQTIEDAMIAINCGVCGFLCEDIAPEQLVKSLDLIADGEMVVHGHAFQKSWTVAMREQEIELAENQFQLGKIKSPPLAALNGQAPNSSGRINSSTHDLNRDLSNRERVIMERLISGNSNKVIARDLVITEATVKVHIKAILRKLRLRNRTQAAIWAREHLFGPENQLKEARATIFGKRKSSLTGDRSSE
jgi:two-component system nitrate/nitrite response regulator NarL